MGHQDLAGFEDLHFPACASARIVAQLAGLHASGVAVAQAPDFLAGLRLPWRRHWPIRMRFVPVVVAHGTILAEAVTRHVRPVARNTAGCRLTCMCVPG